MTIFGASLRTLAFMGAGFALVPHAALAQTQTDEDTDATVTQAEETESQQGGGTIDAFDTIVVSGTKTRNAENVQDVPVAVTAFNSESLEALKIRDIQSLTYSAPNVSLDQIGTSRGNANFSIRGLGVNSSIPSIDPTVGVIVDGVYLGFNGGVVFDLFDLDSIEILRGPQGVLFGRNVTGGAVLINTGNPTEEFRGKFRAAVDGPWVDDRGGSNYTVSGVISGPVIEDTLLFKVGAYYNKDEGYFINSFDDSNHGEAETKILRGALEGRFGALMIRGKLDYFTSEGDGPSGQNGNRYGRDTFDFSIDNPGSYDNEIWTGSVTAELDVGPGTLTNIFGYRKYSGTTAGDIDASPFFLFHSDTETEQEQYSNELRYAMDLDPIELTVGGFWMDSNIAYTEVRDLPPSSPLTFYGGGFQDHKVLGVFANANISLTDRFSVIAGLRWSQEEKDGGVTYIRPRPACSVVDGTCPTSGTNPFIPGENNGFAEDVKWTNWSPKLGVQYEFDRGQIYAHWTRGYRSGGFNFRVTNPAVFETVVIPASDGNPYFDEEKVDNYEIGGKFQTDDRAFTLNGAAYITKITDMQREVNQSSPTAGVSQFILNTADASIFGVEAEARMRVSTGLLFTANAGYIDASYDRILFDISGDGVVSDADLELDLPRVPEFTFGAGVISDIDIGAGSVVTRANLQYRDRFAYTDSNFGWIQDSISVDANITWNTPMEGLSFSLYGKNLLDEVQYGGDTQLPFPGPNSTGVNRPYAYYPAAGSFRPLSKGRQIGVEASFEF